MESTPLKSGLGGRGGVGLGVVRGVLEGGFVKWGGFFLSLRWESAGMATIIEVGNRNRLVPCCHLESRMPIAAITRLFSNGPQKDYVDRPYAIEVSKSSSIRIAAPYVTDTK